MAQLDALALVGQLRQRLVDFGLDANFVRDVGLAQILRAIWDGPPQGGGLVSELWVQSAFPSRLSSETLSSLVKSGGFNEWLAGQLNESGGMPRTRLLYEHQADSLRLGTESIGRSEKPVILVTAGTGAGKTESFLLPMLNLLTTETRSPGSVGMRCLILYPMNALVNDQVDRLYGWLRGQDRLRLFHFTSETPENVKAAEKNGVPNWERCRIRTRQQARGLEDENGKAVDVGSTLHLAPDIVITNYSMLEYMLCRPQDSGFFGDALQCVILDEAHLYTDALAGEITLLLRRLLERCGVASSQVLHLATSATMGRSDDELKEFAATLFSKNKDLMKIIRGAPTRTIPIVVEAPPAEPPTTTSLAKTVWLTKATIHLDVDGNLRLAKEPQQCDALAQPLRLLVGDEVVAAARESSQNFPARMLHAALARAPLVRRLETTLLNEPRLQLQSLASALWGSDTDQSEAATVELLRLSATARQSIDEQPLVPHRLHVLTRLPSEMRACLNPKYSGPESLRWAGLGIVAETGAEKCPHCEWLTLEIKRCDNCGEVCVQGWQSGTALVGSRPTSASEPKPTSSAASDAEHDRLHLWPEQRALANADETRRGCVVVDPQSGELGGVNALGVRLSRLDGCPKARRGKPQAPEIFVFFKHIDSASMADPGPQLQKVLDFRKSLVESRQVLSHGFANEAEFKGAVDHHLRAFAKGELPSTMKSCSTSWGTFSTCPPLAQRKLASRRIPILLRPLHQPRHHGVAMHIRHDPFQFVLIAHAMVVRLALPEPARFAEQFVALQRRVPIHRMLNPLPRRPLVGRRSQRPRPFVERPEDTVVMAGHHHPRDQVVPFVRKVLQRFLDLFRQPRVFQVSHDRTPIEPVVTFGEDLLPLLGFPVFDGQPCRFRLSFEADAEAFDLDQPLSRDAVEQAGRDEVRRAGQVPMRESPA